MSLQEHRARIIAESYGIDLEKADDPCWDGYEQFGTKEKNGKKVPNCVPVKKSEDEEEEEEMTKAQALEILGLSEDFDELEKAESLPPGGEWKTIRGAKVYLKDGKAIAGAGGKLSKKDSENSSRDSSKPNKEEHKKSFGHGFEAFAKELREEGLGGEVRKGGVSTKRTVKAQSTNKTWDDGTPVTKYLSRGGYTQVTINSGEHDIVESDAWFYFKTNGGKTWNAVKKKDYPGLFE